MHIPTDKKFWKDFDQVCNLCNRLCYVAKDDRTFYVAKSGEVPNSYLIGIMGSDTEIAERALDRLLQQMGDEKSFHIPCRDRFVELCFAAGRQAQYEGDISCFIKCFEAIKRLMK